ncbi:hypothetical protein ACFXGT_27895 [Streptomyces sp. NPDC059352]|uniref:hypothetical protein n=1 Tax=Streptomyces sp. NPDC059352 TaxID=3346810 RepID=UPI00369793DC
MASSRSGTSPVAERVNRFTTGGCLTVLMALILVLGVFASWMWYSAWRVGQASGENEKKALASLLQQADRMADDSGRALRASDPTSTEEAADVIWKHTEAPVITHDAALGTFTATVEKAVEYTTAGFPGGGADRAVRCLVFTYTHGPGRTWASRVSAEDVNACRPSKDIGNQAREARTRLANTPGEELTPTGVQQALDLTGRPDLVRVKSAVRRKGVVTVSALISSWDGTVDQCYRFIRPLSDDKAPNSTTAAPVISC